MSLLGVRSAAAVLFFALLAPAGAYAQAAITGIVKDTSGAVLPGATVDRRPTSDQRQGGRISTQGAERDASILCRMAMRATSRDEQVARRSL